MKVAIIGATQPSYERYCPNWLGMQAGLKKLNIPFVFLNCRQNLFLFDELKKSNPDIIIYGLRDIIFDKELRTKIRKEFPKAKIIFWYGDLRKEYGWPERLNLNGLIDVMFVSNDAQKNFYKYQLNIDKVFFLPLAAEPIEKPLLNSRFTFDFVFIGAKHYINDFQERAKIIQFLEENRLKRIDSLKTELREKIFKAMPEIYSSSKICLDISHYTDIPRYTSIRFWEIPAFWGFALTKRFPYCEEFYPENTHRIYWDTKEEALELKNFYLKHDDKRREIIKRAWYHTKENHTYKQRFIKMFKILNL